MPNDNRGDQSGVQSLVSPTEGTYDPRLIDGHDAPGPSLDLAQREIESARAKLFADVAQAVVVEEDMERYRGGEDPTPDTEFPDPRAQIMVLSDNTRPDHCEHVGPALMGRKNAAECLDENTEKELVDFVRACFDMSYEQISQRYDSWRDAEQVHDLYVPTAKLDDLRKNRKGKPRIIDTIKTPYSRAISDTLCTYNLAIFGGMPPFRLEPGDGNTKRKSCKILEQALAGNMRRVGYERTLYQITLDSNRYGMAPTAIYFGDQGNVPVSVDPWSYFPDPRVTSQNRHEAEFTGIRSWASMSALRRRRMYQNLDLLGDTQVLPSWECNRDLTEVIRGQSIDHSRPTRSESGPGRKWKLGSSHVLNTLFVFMDPKQFGIGAPFGLYRITVADEKHVVLFDRSPYPHGEIPVIHGEPGYDAHKTFASGPYDLMMPLQRFQDWLLRARVENVQSIIQNRVVADPHKIVISDILNPNAARLIRTMPGVNPKEALMPVDVPDATRTYWQDLDTAGQLMQRLMAASDTAQGIQSETERTATEIQRLTALGQQRLGTQARLLSAGTIRHMVGQMVSNLQYFGVEGGQVKLPREFTQDEDGWYRWHQHEILGNFDYAVVDGTLPLDPRESGANLMKAVRTLAETGVASDWDMNKFIERLIASFGFEDVDNWRLDEATKKKRLAEMQQAKMAQNPQIQAQIAQATSQMSNKVTSDEDIQRGVDAGNLVPVSQANNELAAQGLPSGPDSVNM